MVQTDQAQIDNAKLQLDYSRITAPLSGRLGLRLVDPGNIVHASDTNGLVVITQLQPIAVVFPIPEDNLPAVRQRLAAGVTLPVEAYDREQQQRLATGQLLTIDNQIDPNTGTVRLKAEFPNDDGALFPNQFVNARLQLDVRRGATLIPTAAVQRGAQGSFVYVVQNDQTVAVRPVHVGVSEGDQVVVDSGVAPGELVVVDGADALRAGRRVTLQSRAATTPSPGAA
jgi:multidrug efflux system membrane fusion protein